MTSALPWVLVAGTVVSMAIGQILFKVAATKLQVLGMLNWAGWLTVPFIAAVALYFTATILWVGALRTLPLRIAYPISAISYLAVPVLAHLLLSEPLTARTLIGAAMIVAGIAVCVSAT